MEAKIKNDAVAINQNNNPTSAQLYLYLLINQVFIR